MITSDLLQENGDPASEQEHAGINAITRALVVLEALADEPQGLSVTELSALLRINKGLTHRVLSSLAERDYIAKDDLTQRYRLTVRMLGLAFRHLKILDVYDVILPILRRLAAKSGELAELNWVERDKLVTVAKADSPRQIRVVSYLGEKQVLHTTAAGKCWLASLPEEEALRLVLNEGLTAFTEQTITTVSGLQAELALVREQGYATNVREAGPYVIAVAAPVRAVTDDNRVVGSVGVVAPLFHDIHLDPDIIAMTKAAAEEISLAWPFVRLEF